MDQQLKQRLTGAVVLVSLAVIFIPVILEGPRDQWTPRERTIPEPPGLDYRAPTDLPVPAPVTATRTVKPDDVSDVETRKPVPPVSAPPTPKPVVQAQASSPPASVPGEQALADGWYVQVGSFSQTENAGRLRDRLRDAGMDAHLHAIKMEKGASYRVLIGPSPTRPQAEKLQQKLATTEKLKGIVIAIGAAGDG
ncbi:MAG: SPOR domain-containing protein [Gammaproteobacteria bacterium]